jgi:chromosome segregation ATPase
VSTSIDPHATADVDQSHDTSAITALTRHVERLEAALEAGNTRIGTLEQERDAERARAAELPVKVTELTSQRDAERRRSEELREERDRWAVQAHALAHPPVPPTPSVVERRGVLT